MRIYPVLLIASSVLLAACSGVAPSADQRRAAADDLNPSGRPYVGPRGTLASAPPADTNFTPLYCHQDGQGTVCSRNSD